MQSSPMPTAFGGILAWPTNTSSMSTSTPYAKSNVVSSSPAATERCKVGGRRSISRTCRVPPDGIPQNLSEHMRLMCDILVLGFQTDTTRVSTLKLNNDHSYLLFRHLDVDVGHHELSHRDDVDYLRVNQFFLEQFAYIARKLDAIQEGERTALDNSMLMYCSSMLTGRHDATQLPIVLLGGAGGQLRGGRTLDYLENPNRKACSLYLSMLAKFGIRPKEFGDSSEPLEEV